jgi:hypothetical protein
MKHKDNIKETGRKILRPVQAFKLPNPQTQEEEEEEEEELKVSLCRVFVVFS